CRFKDYVERIAFMEEYLASIGLSKGQFQTETLAQIVNAFNAERAKNNPTLINELVKKELMMYLD
ncbi:MAG: hypothetical protein K2I87_02020, partial [Bacteroidales bacterium]|nr:hypothetical protein [Bacteroidales bacterium]